jgi:hypothetical protein
MKRSRFTKVLFRVRLGSADRPLPGQALVFIFISCAYLPAPASLPVNLTANVCHTACQPAADRQHVMRITRAPGKKGRREPNRGPAEIGRVEGSDSGDMPVADRTPVSRRSPMAMAWHRPTSDRPPVPAASVPALDLGDWIHPPELLRSSGYRTGLLLFFADACYAWKINLFIIFVIPR